MEKLIRPGRIAFMAVITVLLIVISVVTLYKLQIVEGKAYYEESRNNIVTTKRVTAARGSIMDRYGRVLVQNRVCNNLIIDTTELFRDDDPDYSRANANILQLIDAILAYGDSYIFALVDENVKVGDDYRFSLRHDKINVSAGGEEILKVIPDEVELTGRFSKTEVKENGDRVLHFFYNIGDYVLEAAPEQGYKINSIDGDNCYKNTYRYAVSREKIRLVGADEAGLDGKVTEILDYGNIRFAKVNADNQELLIHVDKDFKADKVRVAFDSSDVSVYSTRIDMKIC